MILLHHEDFSFPLPQFSFLAGSLRKVNTHCKHRELLQFSRLGRIAIGLCNCPTNASLLGYGAQFHNIVINLYVHVNRLLYLRTWHVSTTSCSSLLQNMSGTNKWILVCFTWTYKLIYQVRLNFLEIILWCFGCLFWGCCNIAQLDSSTHLFCMTRTTAW